MRARATVMNLVIRKAAPPYLWVPLLFAAIPVMEASPSAFGMEDTQQLLLSLQVRLRSTDHFAGVGMTAMHHLHVLVMLQGLVCQEPL